VSKVPADPGVITLIPDAMRAYSDPVWRIYSAGGDYPGRWSTVRTFGPLADMRFDPHPDGTPADHPAVGVYYGAADHRTAFAERYYASRTIDRDEAAPTLTKWVPTRPLDLVDLTSDAVVRMGTVAAVQMTDERSRSRAFARALYEQHGHQVDGIYSRSSVNNGVTITLFARAQNAFPRAPIEDERLDAGGAAVYVLDASRQLGFGVL